MDISVFITKYKVLFGDVNIELINNQYSFIEFSGNNIELTLELDDLCSCKNYECTLYLIYPSNILI